jgi:hypothetical protein
MDQRQTQIREGAGLEESRLNVEFIDLLRKWSSPVLMVAAVAALGYWGWQKLQESRLNKLNTAFSQFEAAGSASDPSPDSLRAVAEEYGDVRAVGTMSRLEAADVYLRAVRLGIRLGAQAEADENGRAKFKPDDVLGEADRTQYLSDAELLYKRVVADSTGKPVMMVLHRLSGLYGLAAVSESRSDMAQARAYYEQVVAEAQKTGLDGQVAVAKSRMDGLEALKTLPRVYNTADLPKPPAPPEPPADQSPAPGDVGDGTPDGGDAPPEAPSGEPSGEQPPPAPGDEPAPSDGGQDPQPEPSPEPKPPEPEPKPDEPK